MANQKYSRPHRSLMFAEGPRAFAEMAGLIPSAPFLLSSPRGDQHHVLVMPGLGASDLSTTVLRSYLAHLGYRAHSWNLGRNLGPAMPNLAGQLSDRLLEIVGHSAGEPVSIVGWSMGGVYARILAHHYPDKIRNIVTLGSPFGGHQRSTHSASSLQGTSATTMADSSTDSLRMLAGKPLPGVPSSAIFSKTDAVVPWQIASQTPSAIADNIEVYAGHIGMGFSAPVLYATAERLAQPVGKWQPFTRDGWRSMVFGPADLSPVTQVAGAKVSGATL
jgi:pimeloyl-ACP methyl ester carboxylesterase